MKTAKLAQFVLLAVVALFTISCTKFEDGGLISKTEKNIKKGWSLQKYLYNGVDETALVEFRDYTEHYSDNAKYDRSYTKQDGSKVAESGTWAFEKDQKRIMVSGVGSIRVSDKIGTVSSSYYNITKLTDSELWYTYTNGGDEHEFHLVKK